MAPAPVAAGLWTLWFVTWIIAGFWADRAAKRPGPHREMVYRLLNGVGVALMLGYYPGRIGRDAVLWRVPPAVAWWLLAALVAGFACTWWARIHLGRLWSSSVTRKREHRVIDTGPYRFVRHPIYWGLTLAVAATAILRGRSSAVFGAFILTLGFYVKARLEERFLRAELGEAYDTYARRVGLIVPSIRR